MENTNDKKLLLGLIIGGLIGAGALYCIQARRSQKTPVLKKIGKTISDIGGMIENCNLDSASDVIESIEDKLPSSATIVDSATEWLTTGMKLWNKLKKG